MYSSKKSVNVKKSTKKCETRPFFTEPKILIILCIIAFMGAFLLSRSLMAIERAGLIDFIPPNRIGDFHFHHWAFSMVALSIIIPLAIYFRKKVVIFSILIISMSFFLALFIDGIILDDSVIFWN